jgi:hypothetical protein
MINRKTLLRCAVLASLCVFTLGLSNQLLAQQPGQAPPPASPQTQPATPQSQPTAPQTQPAAPQAQAKPTNDLGTTQIQPAPDPKVPQNDRILWTLPNYLTVENASSLPPLTTGQKLKLVAEGTFDPIEFAFLALEAGVNQASNTNPTFGQGVKGYAKRYALAFGDNTVENFMVAAVFASGLRQDPRYTKWEKESFSAVSNTLPREWLSRARTRGKMSSTPLKSSVPPRPQPSRMPTIPGPGRSATAPMFG